jgi:Fe2+ transport system protein FeoA
MCRVIEKAPFDGPVMVAMNGENVPVSLALASLIEVETFDS